jgi:hypothetical protein
MLKTGCLVDSGGQMWVKKDPIFVISMFSNPYT